MYNLGEIQPGTRVDVFAAGAAVAQYAFVQINTDGKAVTYDGAAAPAGIVGIALDAAAAAGDEIRIAYDGAVAVKAPADVKKGGIISLTSGQSTVRIGYALEDAAEGDAVLARLAPLAGA
mgnify:CR=1 FL=1